MTSFIDAIGPWSEVKLDIVSKYAQAYSTVLSAQASPEFYHVYIDAFAGAGVHISRTTGQFVPGSPLNALSVDPPFREYHLIDLDSEKIALLRELVGDREDVRIHEGDCNEILLGQVFPRVKWQQFRRGLCLLDPYGLHLNWEVIQAAGTMGTIDMFLNFPVMDMNRNVLWRHPELVNERDIARMNAWWGDESWRNIAYQTRRTLFGEEEEKRSIEVVAQAFRKRLVTEAGFKRVPEPLPIRHTRGAVQYYLFFASQKDVAEHIVRDIFDKYRERGMT